MPGAQTARAPTWPAALPPRLRCGVAIASAGSVVPMYMCCAAFQALVHPVTILIAHVVPEARRAVKPAHIPSGVSTHNITCDAGLCDFYEALPICHLFHAWAMLYCKLIHLRTRHWQHRARHARFEPQICAVKLSTIRHDRGLSLWHEKFAARQATITTARIPSGNQHPRDHGLPHKQSQRQAVRAA